MRVLIVEDEPLMAEAIRDGLRLEAIAADIAGDGDTALELLGANAYDIAVLARHIPRPSGDQIAKRIVASGRGMPIPLLTAADRLGATQTARRTVDHRHRGRRRVPDRHTTSHRAEASGPWIGPLG